MSGFAELPPYGSQIVPDTLPDSTPPESEIYQQPQNLAESTFKLTDTFRSGRVIIIDTLILEVDEGGRTLKCGPLNKPDPDPIEVPWENWTFTQDHVGEMARLLADVRGGAYRFDDFLVP